MDKKGLLEELVEDEDLDYLLELKDNYKEGEQNEY